MAIVKSKLLKQLSKNYPNFLKKDLEKFSNIILNEIKQALKRNERVELRGFGVFFSKTLKSKVGRNPKTGQTLLLESRKRIRFKPSKILLKRLNKNFTENNK